MGTWDTGPFDNDTAADWCGDLNDADPVLRPAMVRSALTAVVDAEGYLDSDLAAEAIAAAAIVAVHRPGGPPIDSPYAPDFILSGERLALAPDVDALAVRALDRVVAEDSEWRELWEDGFEAASAQLRPIRAALGG